MWQAPQSKVIISPQAPTATTAMKLMRMTRVKTLVPLAMAMAHQDHLKVLLANTLFDVALFSSSVNALLADCLMVRRVKLLSSVLPFSANQSSAWHSRCIGTVLQHIKWLCFPSHCRLCAAQSLHSGMTHA